MAINNPLLNVLNPNSTNPVDLLRDIKVPPQPKRFGDRFRNMTPEKKQGLSQMLYLFGGALKGNDMSQDMATLQRNQAIRKAEADAARLNAAIDGSNLNAAQKELAKAHPEVFAKYQFESQFGIGTKDTADIRNFNFRENLSPDDQKKWDSMKNQDPLSLYLQEEAKRRGKAPGGVDLTPGQSTIDTEFGKIAAEYTLKGQPQVKANLKNLTRKIDILKLGEQNVSGVGIGIIPDFAKPIMGFQDAVAFEDDIRDIVFQSLREKLGAQFTEKEGDRLVAAAFNKSLDESRNVPRLERLYKTIEEAAKAKEDAILHYNKTGSLQGYESTPLDFESIINNILLPSDYENLSDDKLRELFDSSTEEEQETILRYLKNKENK